jgi:hypothetical protein
LESAILCFSKEGLLYGVLKLSNFPSVERTTRTSRYSSKTQQRPVLCSFEELAVGFVSPPQTMKMMATRTRVKSLWLVRDMNANGKIERRFLDGFSEIGAVSLQSSSVPESQLFAQLFAIMHSEIPFVCESR